MLKQFRKAKNTEIARLEQLAQNNLLPKAFQGKRLPFAASLRAKRMPLIAEYKRASPSLGDINLTLSPEAAGAAYAKAGAGALSVLTEEHYFKGHIDFLEPLSRFGLPLLRKDFIFSPLQVDQTASSKASALLLIVRMLDERMFNTLLERCAFFGLEAVCEIFDRDDLARAKAQQVKIIQVNNRDLDTLRVNLGTSHALISGKDADEFWISASGISQPEDVSALLKAGFNAALVGSALMSGQNQAETLTALLA